jgi:hypothetical protein
LLGRPSTTWAMSPALFLLYFSDRISCFCLGWPWTTIILICASWVAGIIGMNHHTWSQSIFNWIIYLLLSCRNSWLWNWACRNFESNLYLQIPWITLKNPNTGFTESHQNITYLNQRNFIC